MRCEQEYRVQVSGETIAETIEVPCMRLAGHKGQHEATLSVEGGQAWKVVWGGASSEVTA